MNLFIIYFISNIDYPVRLFCIIMEGGWENHHDKVFNVACLHVDLKTNLMEVDIFDLFSKLPCVIGEIYGMHYTKMCPSSLWVSLDFE
jgi:hypothetical protein